MRCDPDTVDLLWRFTHTPQAPGYDPGDVMTWTLDGHPVTCLEVERLRRSTEEDFDALDTLLAVEGVLLNARRQAVLDRAIALGLDVGDVPVVHGHHG